MGKPASMRFPISSGVNLEPGGCCVFIALFFEFGNQSRYGLFYPPSSLVPARFGGQTARLSLVISAPIARIGKFPRDRGLAGLAENGVQLPVDRAVVHGRPGRTPNGALVLRLSRDSSLELGKKRCPMPSGTASAHPPPAIFVRVVDNFPSHLCGETVSG